MDVIKTYIPKRYRSKKLVNSSSGSGGTTVINSGTGDFSPSAFVDSDTFYSMFEYDAINDAIKAKKEFYSTAGITAYGTGTVGGGGGTGVTVYNGLDSTDISLALSANMGKQLNDTKLNSSAVSAWALASVKPVYAISEITGLSTAIAGKSDTTHRHTISEITDFAHVHQWSAIENKPTTFAPSAHTHAFADLTSKPTTLSGYGITDALLSSSYTAADVLTKLKTVDGHSSGLDADTVDGKHLYNSGWWDKLAYIGADGVMEVGKFFDFHETNTGTTDYDGRISSELGVVKWNGYTMYHAGNSNKSEVNWTANTLIATTDITLNALASTDKSVKNFINKFNSMFDTDVNGNIIAKTNLYSIGGISAYQSGAGIAGLKLVGDMNANGKAISNPGSILYNDLTIGYDADEVYSPTAVGLWDANNSAVAVFNPGSNQCFYGFGNVGMDNSGMELYTGVVTAPAFKFGRYKFMEDTNGDLGIYNGTTKIATILKTRTNSNL